MRSFASAWRLEFFLLPAACLAAISFAADLRAAEKSYDTAEQPYHTAEQTDVTAEQLVARALAAEAVGCPIAREKLLREALTVDPNYAPAHWQLGELRSGDGWKTIERASSDVSYDGKAAEYRRRRDQVGENAEEQFRLAKWCGLAGLKDQERAHLLFTLQLQPNHVEAGRRFKQLQRLAEPAARSEEAVARQQAKDAATALRIWRPRLTNLRREALARDPARRRAGLVGLATITDLAALPAIESVFADAEGELASAVVGYFASLNDQRATNSLIRYSVTATHAEVRRAAADALADRSIFSYVPTMMSILVPPTQIEFARAYDLNGQLGYRLSLYQVGPVADVAYTASSTAQDFLTVDRSSGQAVVSIDGRTLEERTEATIEMAQRVAEANVARQERNEKVAETLRVTTGKKLDDAPQSWWTWWLDHNEIYRLPERPVLATMSLARITTAECFAPGTTVWTLSGPMPIEQVKVGESVLSQKPSTGELAYKMVLATTLRPASPLVVIRAEGETIRATRGHPFWVSGTGWLMAKELEAGQWLHTAHGPVKLESVEQTGAAVGHNLLVDGFNTYFVSDRLLLVHDNLIREVSPATVPGMQVAAENAAR